MTVRFPHFYHATIVTVNILMFTVVFDLLHNQTIQNIQNLILVSLN